MSFLSFLFYLLLFLLFSFICLFLYRKTRSYAPRLHFNPDGKIVDILNSMKSLSKPYKPTWWLIGPHLHTIRGMRFRSRSKMTNSCRRELITFADGGTAALDWFETADMKEDTPIMIIIHTCAGGTREPCTNNIAEAGVKRGWRVVVANNRYCSGAPITSGRLFVIDNPDDQERVVDRVREEFKPKHLFIVGFSLGAYQALQYCVVYGKVDAGACVSHTYHPIKAERLLRTGIRAKLYQSVIMAKLTHFAKKSPYMNNPKLRNAKTMGEFDEELYCPGSPYKNLDELYGSIMVYDKIPRAKLPILFLGSDDDPFTKKEYMPIKEIENSEYVGMVEFPEGGHVSFLTGDEGNKSMIDEIIPDFFEAVIKIRGQK